MLLASMKPDANAGGDAARGVPASTAVIAVMIAGACTFLNVYCTQPLLPHLQRIFRATEVEVSLTRRGRDPIGGDHGARWSG